MDEIRNGIDGCDEQIILLLEKRFCLTKEISMIKKNSGIGVFNGAREEVIFNNIKNKSLVHEKEILNIYQAILKISKEQQKELICKDMD